MQELQKNIDKYLESHINDQKVIEELNEGLKKNAAKLNFKLNFEDFYQDFSVLDSRYIDNGPSNWQVLDSEVFNNPNSRISEASALTLNLSLIKDMKNLLRLPSATELVYNNQIGIDKDTSVHFEIDFEFDPSKEYIVSYTVLLSDNLELVFELNRKLKKMRLFLLEQSINRLKIASETSISNLKENSRNRIIMIINIQLLTVKINEIEVYSGDILQSVVKLESLRFKIGVLDTVKFEVFDFRLWSQLVVLESKLINSADLHQQQNLIQYQANSGEQKTRTEGQEPVAVSNQSNQTTHEIKINPIEDSLLITQCHLLKKDVNLCSYLTRIAKRHNIDLSTESSYPGLISKMKESCFQKLRSDVVCNKIVKAAAELVEEIKAEKRKQILAEGDSNLNTFSRLIKACSFSEVGDVIPKNKTLCLNKSLKLKISSQFSQTQPNDCLAIYCKECCSMNYGNHICDLCKLTQIQNHQ